MDGKLSGTLSAIPTLRGELSTRSTILQSKTITPTESVQPIMADLGYAGLSLVTVEPIPDEYVIPTGSRYITRNGTYDISGLAEVEVDVRSSGPIRYEYTTAYLQNDSGTISFNVLGEPVSFLCMVPNMLTSMGKNRVAMIGSLDGEDIWTMTFTNSTSISDSVSSASYSDGVFTLTSSSYFVKDRSYRLYYTY